MPEQLNDKLLYNNRELSWMDFNSRVLDEAIKKDNPIMEKLNFLSITASNLDEFFMVRVAGVKEQINSKYNKADVSGLTPVALMEKLNTVIHKFVKKQYTTLHRSILPALKKEGIEIIHEDKMSDRQLRYIDEYFEKVLFPVLTPLAVDTSRPFPLLANKSLNVAVHLEKKNKQLFAVVQVPSIMPRFIELPSEGNRAFTLLEDIIIRNLSSLFEESEIKSSSVFRITRDSDLEINEDSADLMIAIEKSIKKRKHGSPVRLEILKNCDSFIKEFLIKSLKVEPHEIYELQGPIDLTFFSKFYSIKGVRHLKYESIQPVDPPADFYDKIDIFEAIREHDLFVHHPYESFNSVIRFVNQAAKDPDVLAIKQTLYRVSGKSPIIEALIRAAENGKQVTVLVELKARFDEENNINWAKKLEDAGCHVVYGLQGLKTHCKILLVVRREEEGICRYMHIGTGNYNDSTAKLYTDCGLFTCNDSFGIDASSLFNVLTGYSRPPQYNKMIVAPSDMRKAFNMLIKTEIKNAKQGLPAGITVKVNALVDAKIISQLYEASCAGVKINLIIRGICCLVPGVSGVSENIKVVSIVGQLLEHSRIYKFENAGNPVIYMGSADWMPRNLDKRIELVIPVEDSRIHDRLDNILNIMLNDNVNARVQLSDKSYINVTKRGRETLNCHREFSKLAKQALNEKKQVDYNQPYKTVKSPKFEKLEFYDDNV